MTGERRQGTSAIDHILSSAAQAGIEMDEDEARRWLAAAENAAGDDLIAVDVRKGVFGHRIAMLDFGDEEIAHFRRVGNIVEIPDEDGVETALALSGSAAQSKIQSFPGDCDFFERVNFHAATREDACRRLGEVIRAKALSSLGDDGYRLMEVKFGEYPEDLIRGESLHLAGSSISWAPDEIQDGSIDASRPGGESVQLTWETASQNPGWCKLDWVVADGSRKRLVSASNMIDATWESPGGQVVPLDGYLDPYFQEIYLDTDSVPLFTKLISNVSADALDGYVEQLEKEVTKYLASDEPNVGKAAKRMYNVFRLNGRFPEAAFIRELFDEPANVLYQIYAVIKTIDEAGRPGSEIPVELLHAQLDAAVLDVVRALEGVEEEEIVALLLELREDLSARTPDPVAVARARSALLNVVNNFFHEKLTAMPEVRDYMDEVSARS